MTVRDEASTLERSISSVAQLAERIIIVDTGSRDGSMAIVSRFPVCELHESKWPGDYGVARNLPIQLLREQMEFDSNDWILSLDGDEILPKRTQDALKLALQTDVDGYYLVKNHFTPAGWFANRSLKLFRTNPHYKFRGSICELVEQSIAESGGKTATIKAYINDLGFLKSQQNIAERIGRYIIMLERSEMQQYNKLMYLSYFNALAGDYEKSLKVLGLARKEHDDSYIDLQLACVHYASGELDKAEAELLGIVDCRQSSEDSLFAASVVNKLGQLYSKMGLAKKAYEHYQRSLGIYALDVNMANCAVLAMKLDDSISAARFFGAALEENDFLSIVDFSAGCSAIDTFSELDPTYSSVQGQLKSLQKT
ncbi:MAG: glycosyltransferase family 2 protein [Candidatus Woesearchaeota archaeon]